MENLSLGGSLTLPRVIAGCMRIKDSGVTPEGLLRFVEECLDAGVDAFDHAPVYGGYTIEQYFGDHVLRRVPSLRSRLKIVTKAGIRLVPQPRHTPIYYDSSSSAIRAELEDSLTKLGTDHVDLLLIHRPDPMNDPADTAEALEELVQAGKVLAVGVSNYTPAQVAALQAQLSIPLVANQIELSAARTDNLFNGTLDDAHAHRLGLMAWSPLGGGSVFAADESSRRLRARAQAIADERGAAIDVILYAWLFSIGVPLMAITGTTRMDRIRAAIAGTELVLTREEWYGILEASRGYPVP